MFYVCHAFLSAHCNRVVASSERANLLALLYLMFFLCVFFFTFPRVVLGQVWSFLFDLILYVPSIISQSYRDGSSWVEPVLG